MPPSADVAEPVFRHQPAPAADLPAPQPMPDETFADRERLLHEIRAGAEQEVSLRTPPRIERQPLASITNEDDDIEFAYKAPPEPAPRAAADPAKSPETALDTSDVHAYPAGQTPPAAAKPQPAPPASTAETVEENFMRSLRSQIEEQHAVPLEPVIGSSRRSSVIRAAERAGISIASTSLASVEATRGQARPRVLRDLASDTVGPPPRRRSYSVGVYSAALVFLLALATYLLRQQITGYYPAAGPWLESYAMVIDMFRLLVQDAWSYLWNLVAGLIAQDAPVT